MNAKKSLFWFIGGAVWLAGLLGSFMHASQTVGDNLQNGLIWFGVAIVWAVLGVAGGIRLNKA